MFARNLTMSGAAALVLFLAVAAPQPALAQPALTQPASATSAGCSTLSDLEEDSRKPGDLDVQSPAPPNAGFNISWSIPDDMPTDVLTGHCVHKHHVDTGTEYEVCNYAWPKATSTGWDSCYGEIPNRNCYRGVHRLKVKFTTNCSTEMPYSDSSDYTYGTYTP